MEYERIHKPQTGMISPSKLRMKLLGPHNPKKKDGSNSNSARTSPSKLQDADFVKSSLLATQSGDFEEEASIAVGADRTSSIHARELVMPCDDGDDSATLAKLQHYSRGGGGDGCNSSSVHPIKSNEDENNLDYDSTSSFEFHKGERSLHQHGHLARSYSRPMSSKWNDAEKWIYNRQSMPGNYTKKPYFQNLPNRPPASSFTRVSPESATYENKLSLVKRVDVCQTAPQSGQEKFIFLPAGSQAISFQDSANNSLIDLCPESKDLMEVDINNSCTTQSSSAIRAVSMRDMGTEMTPIPSQEPSRTASPLGSTTPMRSPTSSIPSTPRRGEPAPTPTDQCIDSASQHSRGSGKKELTEQELKLKTKREIVALGVQLGKTNIASWASKDAKTRSPSAGGNSDSDELDRIEFCKRAAAWEEAEKSKHSARFKRQEIKIQAWESQQKAKLEAEMRKIEAQVEQMRAQAQAKMVKKISMARQKSEEKRASSEARKNQEAEKVSEQVEYIRHTGRLPSSSFACCGW